MADDEQSILIELTDPISETSHWRAELVAAAIVLLLASGLAVAWYVLHTKRLQVPRGHNELALLNPSPVQPTTHPPDDTPTFRGLRLNSSLSENVPSCVPGSTPDAGSYSLGVLDSDLGLEPPAGARVCHTKRGNSCLSSWVAGYGRPAGTECFHVIFDDSLRSVLGATGDVLTKGGRSVEVRTIWLPNPPPAKDMFTEKYGTPTPLTYSVQGDLIQAWRWTSNSLVAEILRDADGTYGYIVQSQDWNSERDAESAQRKARQLRDF
jgi:hypothetical protein